MDELKEVIKCFQVSSSEILNNSILQNEEIRACQKFSVKYHSERQFHNSPQASHFKTLLSKIVRHRIVDKNWRETVPFDLLFRNVTCLRILLRDKSLLSCFIEYQATPQLALLLHRITDAYFENFDAPYLIDLLRTLSTIFQKLSAIPTQIKVLTDSDTHKYFVLLLASSDVTILHCSLLILINISQNKQPLVIVSQSPCAEYLLPILEDYDKVSKTNAASLLRLLLSEKHTREQLNLYNGIPVLLSLVQSKDHVLLWHVIWCLVQLAKDTNAAATMCRLGGIPLLLSLLSDKNSTDSASTEEAICLPTNQEENDERILYSFNIKSGCCAALAELVQTDTNAQKVILNNGLYLLTVLLLNHQIASTSEKCVASFELLQCNVFRTLRFLFSMERNRRFFKKLFPAALYEMFIDVGHYNQDISAYQPLVSKLKSLSTMELEELRDNILLSNMNRESCQNIRDYEVLELLGSGAFGSVYKARKKDAAPNTFFAIKEVNTLQAALGRTAKERDKSVGEIISELTIIKDKLRHPNCVRYYRTFVDNDRLYIVMEMIEGASLAEYFVSLREKGNHFPIERIWLIFIQLVLVLRYLHKEKAIVHRDLSPNNIMLGEYDRVTVTDFGLAKRKREDSSQMNSIVGTILYACPEIVQHHPYTEKADVWSLGCVLYQMCTLTPPFNSSNMLSLATKIVDGDYEPIAPTYGPKIDSVVAACLTPDPEKRPDILGVAAHITEEILLHLDQIRNQQINVEKKLEREKRRNLRYCGENSYFNSSYHRVLLANHRQQRSFTDLQPSPSSSTFTAANRDIDGISDEASCSSRPNSGSVGSPGHTSVLDDNGLDSLPPHKELNLAISNGEESVRSCPPSDMTGGANSQMSSSFISNTSQDSMTTSVHSPVIQLRMQLGAGKSCTRSRPDSGSTLTIAQHRLRPVNDPILRLLSLVHKIVCISQLPPDLNFNPRKKLVERFKRSLFSNQLSAPELKKQLLRLLERSREPIDLDLGDISLLSCHIYSQLSSDTENNDFEVSPENDCLTYEQMLGIIESVLDDIGYYDLKKRIRSPISTIASSKTVTPNSNSPTARS